MPLYKCLHVCIFISAVLVLWDIRCKPLPCLYTGGTLLAALYRMDTPQILCKRFPKTK